jgi:hypothetical protein
MKKLLSTILFALIVLTGQAKTNKTVTTSWTVPADWFKTDTITIQGHIEGYDAEQFGYTSMECYFEDISDKDASTFVHCQA